MIRIVNKRFHTPTENDVYIGRGPGSRFGNPFTHKEGTKAKHIVSSRAEAVEKYRPYLRELYRTDRLVKITLDCLARKYNRGENINLVCWCTPKEGLTVKAKERICHGQVIAEAILKIASKYLQNRYGG